MDLGCEYYIFENMNHKTSINNGSVALSVVTYLPIRNSKIGETVPTHHQPDFKVYHFIQFRLCWPHHPNDPTNWPTLIQTPQQSVNLPSQALLCNCMQSDYLYFHFNIQEIKNYYQYTLAYLPPLLLPMLYICQGG